MDTVIVFLEDVPQFIELPPIKTSIEGANVELATFLSINLIVFCNSCILLCLIQRVRIFFSGIFHVRQKCSSIW